MKILLFSHSGLSDQDANGITMKNLLSAWEPEELAEFFCDVQSPDFEAAHNYFRVTDMDMMKAFFGKKTSHILTMNVFQHYKEGETDCIKKKEARRIPTWLKRQKYNFFMKWLRECLWMISPWGHRTLLQWIREFSPDAIMYMVGESLFMDSLVLKVRQDIGKPLILYNGEAFRIIDLGKRNGLERLYYRKIENNYERLHRLASMIIFNCDFLKKSYVNCYGGCEKSIVAYNSASNEYEPYEPDDNKVEVTYFGNLGVGRVDSLIQVAEELSNIDDSVKIDIYGRAKPEDEKRFSLYPNIRYHGFIGASQLKTVINKSDILLHVESFDKAIVEKLKYAFSTKIAQCLCAGRCFLSYAPENIASSQYLQSVDGAVVVTNREELRKVLTMAVKNKEYRIQCASRAHKLGMQNHSKEKTSGYIKSRIEEIVHDEAL